MLLKYENRILKLLKSHSNPQYGYRTVLSNSSFEYVELWLRSEATKESKKALFYWKQAQHFYHASELLPIEAKPLTAYYSILNATKALLAIKGVAMVNIGHGASSPRQTLTGDIKKDEITYEGNGVLWHLSKILGDPIVKSTHKVYDLLYNLPCVHRTFTITYGSATELFIPIKNVNYELTNVRDASRREAFLRFEMDSRYDNSLIRRFVNKKIQYATPPGCEPYYRVKRRVKWNIHTPITDRLADITKYHCKYRNLFYYIQGTSMLWYIKKELPLNSHLIDRHSMTLIYGVMHWLSELVRYNPQIFDNIMNSRQNWLIREFIDIGLPQFVDEISSEITGANIMCTGYRK